MRESSLLPDAALVARFWAKVSIPTNLDNCWLWTAYRNKHGYGALGTHRVGKTTLSVLAHRLAFVLAGGVIPPDMCVLHHCDNPPCVNSDHLWLGTRKDNNLDMMQKRRNRQPQGEATGLAKLTDSIVTDIYTMDLAYGDATILANEYNVSKGLISHIRTGRVWKHITKELTRGTNP